MKIQFFCQIVLMACLCFSGCAGVGVNNTMRRSDKTSHWNPFVQLTEKEKAKKAKKESKPAESFVVIWRDTVLEKPGTPAVRGFGGRIHFFDADNAVVKSEGELVVYGFDDSDAENAAGGLKTSEVVKSTQADRKFVFPADQLETHFSETEIGPSYSVWIPWEKKGGHRKVINLIPVFKTADGRVLKSEPSLCVLPGKPPGSTLDEDSQAANSNKSGVELARFISDKTGRGNDVAQAELTEDEYNQTRIRTSTIKLTPALANQLAITSQSPAVANIPEPSQPIDQTPNSSTPNSIRAQSASGEAEQPATGDALPESVSVETVTETKPKRQAVFGAPGSFR